MKRKNPHDKIIDDLEQRLINSKTQYDIFKKLEYGPKHRLTGEIDLYATTGKYNLYFEIKSNNSDKGYKTAIKQLERIKDKFAALNQRNWYLYATKGLIKRVI